MPPDLPSFLSETSPTGPGVRTAAMRGCTCRSRSVDPSIRGSDPYGAIYGRHGARLCGADWMQQIRSVPEPKGKGQIRSLGPGTVSANGCFKKKTLLQKRRCQPSAPINCLGPPISTLAQIGKPPFFWGSQNGRHMGRHVPR